MGRQPTAFVILKVSALTDVVVSISSPEELFSWLPTCSLNVRNTSHIPGGARPGVLIGWGNSSPGYGHASRSVYFVCQHIEAKLLTDVVH